MNRGYMDPYIVCKGLSKPNESLKILFLCVLTCVPVMDEENYGKKCSSTMSLDKKWSENRSLIITTMTKTCFVRDRMRPD